jgi:TPR repeat protein
VSKAHSQRTLLLSRSEESERSNGSLPTLGERAATGELVPLQRYLSEKRRQFRRGVLLGMCISVAMVVPTMKYLSYRHENRGFEKTPAKLADQKGSADALPTATLKASTESSTAADSLGSDNQKKDVAEARRPTILSTETGGHSGPSAPKAPATNPSSRARLQTSSGGNASRQKPTMTPQQLWTSVQAGNTKAAVALAELYIKGEGVPQSCNQARVLLLVASEKRNAEAIKRLHELDKTGCP